jgi:hypothetical protein
MACKKSLGKFYKKLFACVYEKYIYVALQNKNGVSCLTVTINKRQLTVSCGRRNCKWHAGILKNCDE